MVFGIFRTNNRIVSLAILIAACCGATNICCCSADDSWNNTVQEATKKFIQQLVNLVNTTKQPCHDFHSYICDKLPTASISATPRLNDEEIFQHFLLQQDEDQLMDVELKLKRFYESCQNARSVDDLKSSHLYRISGGWPAIESGGANRRESPPWMKVVASFHDIGVDYFFKHRVEMKSNKRYVRLEANLNLKYSLLKNIQLAEELLKGYEIDREEARLIALDFAGLEGYRREVAKSESGATSILTYAEFKTKYTNIDWDTYFRRVLGKPLRDTDGIRLEDEQRLERIFEMLSRTPSTRLLNYVWIDYLIDKGVSHCVDLVKEYFKPVYQYIVQRSSIDKRRVVSLFSEIGSVYHMLLPSSVWIDEIANEKSQLYLGKMIHMTLNGDAKLDADYASLTLTKKNFYRNLEKCQKFAMTRAGGTGDGRRIIASSLASMSDLYEFFMGPMYNELLPQPLYYGSIGEAFAEKMIDGGGVATIPGSWRSSDSDEKYAEFERCLRQQNVNFTSSNVIANNLVRRLLAERQTFEALRNWVAGNADMANRVRQLVASVERELNLEKLYFYMSVFTHCNEGKEFVNLYLKNSGDFAETFGCSRESPLNPVKVCNVL